VPKPPRKFCQNINLVRLGRRSVLDHPGCGQIAEYSRALSTPAVRPDRRSVATRFVLRTRCAADAPFSDLSFEPGGGPFRHALYVPIT
jgi:hypothetical protein